MTLYRPQRGGLEESMKEVTEVANLRALATLLGVEDLNRISVVPYYFDKRIEWDTYVVKVDHDAVGFTNGQL